MNHQWLCCDQSSLVLYINLLILLPYITDLHTVFIILVRDAYIYIYAIIFSNNVHPHTYVSCLI